MAQFMNKGQVVIRTRLSCCTISLIFSIENNNITDSSCPIVTWEISHAEITGIFRSDAPGDRRITRPRAGLIENQLRNIRKCLHRGIDANKLSRIWSIGLKGCSSSRDPIAILREVVGDCRRLKISLRVIIRIRSAPFCVQQQPLNQRAVHVI